MPDLTPPEPRPASSVVLWREGPEVFWVLRGKALRFSGGFWAFPGGRVDAGESFEFSAARELFEETGVLAALGDLPAMEERAAWRRRLLSGEVRFDALLLSRGLAVDAARFVPAGRWITPPMMPIRFDARFFLARCPEGQEPEVWPGELSAGEWVRPAAALRQWERGERLLHPPARHALETVASGEPASWPARMAAPPHSPDFVAQRIELQGGVMLVPLRTPTLPPATHTNVLVLGEDELVVIDPGSPWPEEQAYLMGLLRDLAAEGRSVVEIWLTHHHGDHVGGAEELSRALGNTPIAAHRRTAELLLGKVRVDRHLEDGEVRALPGRLGLRLRVVFTPGHSPGHVCIFEEKSRAVFAGDMVAGVGTVVVDPPLGDMGQYLDSLRRLLALDPRTLYPAHGPVILDGPAKLTEYLAHREERERQVLAALSAEARTTEALVPSCYPEVAPAVYPLAARSLTAILLKLEREGRAVRDGESWRRA